VGKFSDSLRHNVLTNIIATLWRSIGQDAATFLCLVLSATLIYVQTIVEYPPEWLRRLDFVYYDLRFSAMPLERDENPHKVVILDIDDTSIQAEGRWPWPREKLAELTASAFDAGAIVVSYDIVFSEPQQNIVDTVLAELSNNSVSSELKAYRDNFDGDKQLADAMSMGDAVLGYFTTRNASFQNNTLPAPLITLDKEVAAAFVSYQERGHTSNLAMFQEAAARSGFVTAFPDSDGSVRRSPLMVRFGDQLYPSMALSSVLAYLLVEDAPEIKIEQYGPLRAVRAIKIADNWINTDINMNVMVPYRGGPFSFPYVSATALINGDEASRQTIEGAIVLVGTSAAGLYDLRSTPVSEVYPGVEVHANLIDGMLMGEIPYRPDWEKGASFVTLLVFGLLFSFIFPRVSPLYLLLLGLSSLSLSLGVNNYLWIRQGMELPIASQLILILGTMMIAMAQGFLSEAATRQRIKDIFDQYVPPQHVNTMLQDPESINLDGESRDMTIFFMDIRDFTSISESLDAARLKRFLSLIFTPVTQCIFDHQGTIDKYVGDMVMAFWGAPLKDENHREHGVRAAMAISQMMHTLRQHLKQQGYPEAYVGIGMNSGVVNVGDMGSEIRRAYTVIGDPVNLASRIEGMTKFYGLEFLVGEETYRPLAEVFLWREVDLIQAKGKEEAVAIYTPLADVSEADDTLLQEEECYRRARSAYLAQRWDEAEALFSELNQQRKLPLFEIYLGRIAHYRVNTPEIGWLGVYRHLTK
jgi:adenylate cyclase